MNIKIKKYNIDGPKIAIVGCVHGNELIGEKVMKKIRNLDIKKGQLATIIANEKAMKKGARFIDTDLNRSFPGNKNGTLEEEIAFKLLDILKNYDFIIDIHSTTTDTKSLIIITRLNSKIKKILRFLKPKRIALMPPKFSRHSLSYNAKMCVSFEYGKDKSAKALKETIKDIKNLLLYFDMIDGSNKNKNKTEFYKIVSAVKKEKKFKLHKISNFKLVKKGQIIAKCKNEKINADEDFYPILFGERAYKDIFGFKAKKLRSF